MLHKPAKRHIPVEGYVFSVFGITNIVRLKAILSHFGL